MKKRKDCHEVNRTPGVLAALDYLGLDFGSLPVVGRTNEAIPLEKSCGGDQAEIWMKIFTPTHKHE